MKRQRRQQLPADPVTPPERRVAVGLTVFCVALAIRLMHVWQMRRSPFASVLMGDARGYDEWAQRLAAGDWFGGEVFYQAPLYPYFLGLIYAIAGRDLTIVRVVQAIIGSAACVLVALACWRLFSRRVALVAGLGMAIYAPAVFFDGLIQKSVLDVFFISLALWLLSGMIPAARLSSERQRRGFQRSFLALGLAMGALSLTRENALLLVAVVLGWILLSRERDRRINAAATYLLGLAIVLVPVAARNSAVGGGLYLTTSQFGPNFYIGNNARSDGTYSSLRPGRGAPEYERQDATELAELAMGRRLTPAEVSSYWTDRALSFIASQPGSWLKLVGRKLLLLVNADEMLDTESQESYAEWSWPLRFTGWFAHFGVLVPLAVVGVWATWPERRRLGVFYALTIAYAASVVMFYVFARYRFPLVPMLFVFASPGLLAAMNPTLSRRRSEAPAAMPSRGVDPRRGISESSRWGWGPSASGKKLAVLSALAAATAVATNWPLLSTTLMQAITENNLATAFYERKRLDEAIDHYRRAIALRPDYAPAYRNMGAALRASGRLQEAVAAHANALEIDPGDADAHYNLANALLDLNKPKEAAEHFRLAGRDAPSSGNVENNLGIALAADGKMAEAAAAFRRALAIEPDSARAHRNLGDALTSLGELDEGVRHLRRAIELEPGNAAFHYDLAVALLEGGRTADAIDAFRAALKVDPDFAAAHNNLGVALASTGRLDEGIVHFERALAIQPDYADARRNLDMALGGRTAAQQRP